MGYEADVESLLPCCVGSHVRLCQQTSIKHMPLHVQILIPPDLCSNFEFQLYVCIYAGHPAPQLGVPGASLSSGRQLSLCCAHPGPRSPTHLAAAAAASTHRHAHCQQPVAALMMRASHLLAFCSIYRWPAACSYTGTLVASRLQLYAAHG